MVCLHLVFKENSVNVKLIYETTHPLQRFGMYRKKIEKNSWISWCWWYFHVPQHQTIFICCSTLKVCLVPATMFHVSIRGNAFVQNVYSDKYHMFKRRKRSDSWRRTCFPSAGHLSLLHSHFSLLLSHFPLLHSHQLALVPTLSPDPNEAERRSLEKCNIWSN